MGCLREISPAGSWLPLKRYITYEHFNPEWAEGQDVAFDDIRVDTGLMEKSSWGFCSDL
ncbi:hypothetical protein PILCRDRAFT_816711, partial [Piloderma croceum F 1598]